MQRQSCHLQLSSTAAIASLYLLPLIVRVSETFLQSFASIAFAFSLLKAVMGVVFTQQLTTAIIGTRASSAVVLAASFAKFFKSRAHRSF